MERTLRRLRVTVGQAQHVVEKAILFIPHPIWTDVAHGRSDPDEVFHELERPSPHSRIVHRHFGSDFQHVLTKQCHPGGTVGLFKLAASRQRARAVEHADVVESQKAAFENVLSRAVLAIDPPGEIEQQLLKELFEEFAVAFSHGCPFELVDGTNVAQACTGGFTSPKFHS